MKANQCYVMVGVYQCEEKASKHSTLNIYIHPYWDIFWGPERNKEIMNFILNLTVNRENKHSYLKSYKKYVSGVLNKVYIKKNK